jgi:hypothetical protein
MRFMINIVDGMLTVMSPDKGAAVAWAKAAILAGHTVFDKNGRNGKSGSLAGLHRKENPTDWSR